MSPTVNPTLLLLLGIASRVAATCYSMDGQELDAKYQPCFPEAESSACCQLNGTQGENQQNDLCLDSGICQSTSGWFAGFLYINGCTDQTGKADGCAKLCSFLGNQYSWSVLQCEPGKFCCRAGSDTSNCCGSNKTMISTSHIGNLLLPGSTAAINTTYNASTDVPGTTSGSSDNSTCPPAAAGLINPSQCPVDNSAVVGGAVGGVLGAALIGALVALAFLIRSRKHYKTDLSTTQAALTTTEMMAAEEKVDSPKQLEDQQKYAQNTPPQYPVSALNPNSYVVPGMQEYHSPSYHSQYTPPAEMPHESALELSELSDGPSDGRIELTSEAHKP